MTDQEIKEITDKLEALLLKFEAGLTFEERGTWQLMWRLLDHFEALERDNERLADRNLHLERQIMLNFEKFQPQVHS